MASGGAVVPQSSSDAAVLMVPFPMQGHLNQLLHLSRLLAAAHLPVHFAATAAHCRQARRRFHGGATLSAADNIFFHHLPPLHTTQISTRPDPNSTTHFPSHLQPLFDAAAAALRRPVADLTRRLCAAHRRVAIICDSLMGSVVQDFLNFPNAEAYAFHSVSAYAVFFFLWESLGRPFRLDPEVLENLPSLDGCFTPEFLQFVASQHRFLGIFSGRIYNTCRILENKFLDLLSEIDCNKKQWPLGPFNPVDNFQESPAAGGDRSRHECLKWLDGHGRNSVILVCFGTSTTLPERQIWELAAGLENSRQKFVWVVRGVDGDGAGDDVDNGMMTEIELPLGFEERVKDRAVVVRDWAPQLAVLGHPAIGGFMSHCGWNSSMESISMGVPIAAWPMHSDQPRNAALIGKLGVGVAVRDWNRREEIVEAAAVSSAVRRLMASEEGDTMRIAAGELGAAVREAAAAEMKVELQSLVSYLTR
ncbi:zeatin O-glucosyltransferase-like [Andrographis paniculata]|uniref:zeatin O-glucosyltransferase-like n=1 Tax=Andrographis paniculata TaxID=175694 RepID=UPI0021E827AF|nr:zeatin O-glucosyltransferase-like [Andrographis paniculata]